MDMEVLQWNNNFMEENYGIPTLVTNREQIL